MALRYGRHYLQMPESPAHILKTPTFAQAMKLLWNLLRLRGVFALAALGLTMLAACAKPNTPLSAAKSIPVPIHGVNYTGEPFRVLS